MKKTIFVTQFLDGAGGVVRVISNWANYFSKQGIEVEVVSVRKGKPYFDLERKVRWTIKKFKFDRAILNIPYNTFLMYSFLKKKQDTNIVFNKSLYIEPIWLLRRIGLFKNINLIYFAHGGSSDFRDFYLSRKGTAHRVKMIFDAFDKVVCLYDDDKNYPRQVKKEKLFFISNPLPFDPVNVPFEQKENIVLSLGRVTREKGIDTLIKAWNILGDHTKDWKLQIVGEGKDKEDFIDMADSMSLHNVEFLDATTDVKPFYEKAKIFVIPSLWEGMPMTILEAMACKPAVISSKTAGGNKLIAHEKNGLLFEIGNETNLAECLHRLIKDEPDIMRLSNEAYQYVQKYRIENIVPLWDEVLW